MHKFYFFKQCIEKTLILFIKIVWMKCFCTTIIDLRVVRFLFCQQKIFHTSISDPPPPPKPHDPQAEAPVVAMALVVGKIP